MAASAPPRRDTPDSALSGVSARLIKPRLTLQVVPRKDCRAGFRLTVQSGSRNQMVRAGRPDALPKPSIKASVPSRTESRVFTSCNQE